MDISAGTIRLTFGSCTFTLDRENRALQLARGRRGRNLLAPADESWLVLETPSGERASLDALEPAAEGRAIVTSSADGRIRVRLAPRSAAGHLAFDVERVDGIAATAILHARLHVAVKGLVGEHIATVHGGNDAVGFQGLSAYVTGRGEAVREGASISVAVRVRAGEPRKAFALFACAGDRALETIGVIEEAEGLPHPTVGGAWAKTSRATRQSYLVADFSPTEVDEALGYVEQAGLATLYLPPWIWSPGTGSWGGRFGHFDVNTDVFRGGRKDLRALADRSASRGVAIGAHTMSAWISPDDPYVSPRPHPELGYWAEGVLVEGIGDRTEAGSGSLRVRPSDCTAFRERLRGEWFQYAVVRVGDELVRYASTEPSGNEVVLGSCTRGAFGTTVAEHEAGSAVRFLVQAYDHFVPEPGSSLAAEQARQLAGVMNECRLGITSFDGLESHGHRGEWGMNLLVESVFRGWDHHVVCDASQMNHWLWHVLSRGNWGENMVNLRAEVERRSRLDNVALHLRNLLPPALGWWPLRLRTCDYEATSPDDFEYLLAKAAGYDALFCIETDIKKLRAHPQTGRILSLVKAWEGLRHRGAFTDAQREHLRTPGLDFRLDTARSPWRVTPVRNEARRYLEAPRAGQAVRLVLSNPYAAQPLRFTIRVTAALDRDSDQAIPLVPRTREEIRPSSQAGTLTARLGDGPGGIPSLALTCDHTSPFAEVVPASNAPAIRDRHTCPPVRLLWTAPGGASGMDLSRHRGLGMWLDAGSGCPGALLFVELVDRARQVRQYYAPLDEPGRRRVEWPNGEASADEYYDYEWARGPDCGFAQALKWFEYAAVAEVRIGMIRIPPGRQVTAVVEGLAALPEREAWLDRPAFALGGQRMEVDTRVAPEHYLVCEAGESAVVYDANWGEVARAPVRGGLVVPAGESVLELSSSGSGLQPWLAVELRVVGPGFDVRDG